jgi:flagellar biosynthetic protein FliR
MDFTGILLGFGRAAGLFFTAPIFQGKMIPVSLKIMLALGLALIVSPFIKVNYDLLQINPWIAAAFLVQEILVGLIMGFVVNLTFYTVQITGYFLDVPMGFGMINIIDPASGTEMPLFGQFNFILAGLIFLAINGHHTLIVSFINSYHAVQPGMFLLRKEAVGLFVQAFSQMFLLGVKISIPILGTIFLTDVALGIMAKLMPQINIFVVGFAIKIIVGFLVLILFLPVYVMLIENTFSYSGDVFKTLRLMLQQMSG